MNIKDVKHFRRKISYNEDDFTMGKIYWGIKDGENWYMTDNHKDWLLQRNFNRPLMSLFVHHLSKHWVSRAFEEL